MRKPLLLVVSELTEEGPDPIVAATDESKP